MRAYRYVGSHIFTGQENEADLPPRYSIKNPDDVAAFTKAHADESDVEGCVPGVFIVDLKKKLWVADRYSEQVACARGHDVFAAGEIFFELESQEVVHVTNQSTGYCPEPSSWDAVAAALKKAKIPHPDGFDPAFEFRRCRQCWNVSIVKDGDFDCLMCGAELPAEWNLDEKPPEDDAGTG